MDKHNLVIKYIVTGVSVSLIDVVLLYVFKEHFGFWYLKAAAFAIMVSYTTAFVVQKYWTFSDYSDHNLHGQFFRYILSVFLSIVFNLAVFSSLVEFTNINYLLAQVASLIVGGVIGFVMNVRNVFSHLGNDNGLVIAAGIFPPEIGGPATQIYNLTEELVAHGVKVSVVTYSRARIKAKDSDNFDITRISSGLPTIFRGVVYLVMLFLSSVKHATIFAQDITSTGIPAMIVKKLLPHKKFVIRIGGDLLWERKVESGETGVPLVEYYKSGVHMSQRLFKIGRSVMTSADQIVVPAGFLKDVYIKYYNVPDSKITVIKNPVPVLDRTTLGTDSQVSEKVILFAGRFLKLKNLDRLVQAFLAIYEEIKPAKLVLVGDGPERDNLELKIKNEKLGDRVSVVYTLSRNELMSEISRADLCICPSISEVNSNFTLECLAMGKPVLLTRYNGLSVNLPEEMLVSPDSQEDLQNKIKALLSGRYDASELEKLVKDESDKNSSANVLSEYFKIFDL